MNKLKSCKGCGGQGIIDNYDNEYDINYYRVYCDKCSYDEDEWDSEEDAVDHWNRRYHPTCKTCKNFCSWADKNDYCSKHSELE